MAQAVTASIAATLRRLTEAASDLVFLDLPRRVAKILLSQPREDDGGIRLGLSQEQLAHQAGGTRQSVNTALRGFERRGWIEVHDRVITVRQAVALSQFAGLTCPRSDSGHADCRSRPLAADGGRGILSTWVRPRRGGTGALSAAQQADRGRAA